jgi:hypothetical protein
METPKSPWIWGFLLLGVFLIGLSLYFGQRTTERLNPVLILARAEKLTGQATIVRNGGLQKENLERRTPLGHLDSVETGDLGEVRLDFESAYRVRLKEQSLATLERVEDQDGFHVVLILKRGNIEIENFGREGDLFIAKNGERISASDYQQSPLAQVPTSDNSAAATPTPMPDRSLTEKEIQEVMASHRTSFLKCYTQLLQKNPAAKGEATLTFTVENNGKVSAAEVTSATLQQADFKKCLIEVMNRVEFRSYEGPPVSTLFPLKFE